MTHRYTIGDANYIASECITCGIRYFVPELLYNQQREKGGFHTCPNGHQQGWTKEASETERLRRERDLLKQQAAQKDDEIRQNREGWDKASHEAARLRKRAKGGACPCCNRSFSNMARHIATKHPEFETNVVKIGSAKKQA